MCRARSSLGSAWLIAILVAAGPDAWAQPAGDEAVQTSVIVMSPDGRSKHVIHKAARRLSAPNWSPDSTYLILNGGGRLWRLPTRGGEPTAVPTGSAGWIDVNHGISPDGKWLAFTAGPVFVEPAAGGAPTQATANAPSYFHSWSPDGRTLAYVANRGSSYDIYASDIRGGPERRLTAHEALDDCPDYSPDGRWIYFNSDRSGNSDIWRIPAAGAGPGDAKAERVTSDDLQDWFPHPSPDGKSLIFLSYTKDTRGHPMDQDVVVRRVPLPGAKVTTGKPDEVVRFVGGHGSIGSNPWSPDSSRFAYVSRELPPPTLRVVFNTPSDVKPPPGVEHRLTQVADAAEKFFVSWMKRWKYPPANERIFRRKADGSVEVLYVKGKARAGSGRYQKPTFAAEVIDQATKQYKIAGPGHVWWIWSYLGDPPKRIDEYRGHGDSRDGGWAIVNYSTAAGEIGTDAGLATGFNETFTLKGCIHELGHALGLPHLGPVPGNGLGNTLMGPNNSVFAARKLAHADEVYLSKVEAAMLWRHPLLSGSAKDRALQPTVKLTGYKASFNPQQRRVTISGKVTSDLGAHTAVVLDDVGHPEDEYWLRGYAARTADDGTFKVVVDAPLRTDGHYRILFCFENGAISGDHATPDYYGAIVQSYRFRNGRYLFGD
jgi:hypothetical protein